MKSAFFGQTKSGKTTASHALSLLPLFITMCRTRYNSESQLGDEDRKIGNSGDSQTEVISKYDLDDGNSILDLPSIDDTRGEDYNVRHLMRIEDELKKHQKLQVVICVEKSSITEANGSQLIVITNNLINLLSLSNEDLKAILIIVTKSSPGFCKELSEIYNRMCPTPNNFMIEAIKSGRANLVDFEQPVADGSGFKFRKENLQDIRNKLSMLGSISTNVLAKNLLAHILAKMNRILRAELRTEFIFASKLQKNISIIETNSIFCVDSDLNVNSNKLTIKARNIIVLSDLSAKEKKFIKLQGEAPTIDFSEVKSVRNGSNLVVSVVNTIEFDFTDPRNKEFNKNTEFFLIEMIFVNGPWTLFGSFNNKALALIAYIKPQNGAISNSPDRSIKIISADIRLKLCIIEELKSKESMRNTYKSLKDFNSVDAYLNESGKLDLAQEIKVCLEEYALNIPSIFQILVGQTIKRFGSSAKQVSELFSIRRMLIIRYLNAISDIYLKNNSEVNSRALEKFDNFLGKFNAHVRDLAIDKNRILENLLNYLNNLKNEHEMRDFFCMLNDFIEARDENYTLPLAMADQKPNRILTCFKAAFILVGSFIEFQILSKKMGYTQTNSTCMVGLALLLGFTAHLIIGFYKSGYFEGEYKLDSKQLVEYSPNQK